MEEIQKNEGLEDELSVSTLEDASSPEERTDTLTSDPDLGEIDQDSSEDDAPEGALPQDESSEEVSLQVNPVDEQVVEAGEEQMAETESSEEATDPAAEVVEDEAEAEQEPTELTDVDQAPPEQEIEAAAEVDQVELAVEEEIATDESEVVEEEIEKVEDDRQWYVVHCYSGYENKVRHNLEQRIETMGMKNKIFDVVVPTEEEMEVRDGKRRTVERRVFPGYILVQMLMSEDSWYVVRNTPGVTGFVGMGNDPTPLRPEEVSQIIRRMEAEAPRIKVTYAIGQKVRIIDGPFNDFIGTVDDIDVERAKVRVMVSFFGRETPVELDFLQVEKA
jgi:transcriptional antiterminator NusG